MKKQIVFVLLVFIILITGSIHVHADEIQETGLIKAKVITNYGTETVENNDIHQRVQKLLIRIEEGEYEGEEHEMNYVLTKDEGARVSFKELQEKDEIYVVIHQKDGEIHAIIYQSSSKNTTLLWVAMILLIACLFVIARKKAIQPFLIFIISMALGISIILLGIHHGWNLIMIVSIYSGAITIGNVVNRNGMNKEGWAHYICIILVITLMGILSWVLYDIVNFADIKILISSNWVSLRELICIIILLLSCGVANVVDVISWLIETNNDKFYKKKSNNIIEGQRSLKL